MHKIMQLQNIIRSLAWYTRILNAKRTGCETKLSLSRDHVTATLSSEVGAGPLGDNQERLKNL